MSKVVLTKCKDYKKVKQILLDSLKLIGGIKKYIKKGSKVLIKPNLSDPLPPEKAATTHPLLIKAIVEIVQETGAKVTIGECSAGNVENATKKAFDICGVNEIANQTGALTRNFQEEDWILKNIPDYKILKKADFAQALFEADFVINVPKLKTHGITFITSALKNTFGCVEFKNRALLHRKLKDRRDFAQALVDVYSFVKPQLTIIDAVLAMEGDEGPSYGNPVDLGYVIISEDGVAADAVAAHLTGHRALALPIICHAHERGLGIADLKKITVLGDKLTTKKDFKRSSLFHDELNKHDGFKKEFEFQPSITELCMKCGACFNSCPVSAISFDEKTGYKINEEKCIQCLCCHEVCVHAAIKLNKKYFQAKRDKNSNLRLGLECNENCVFCTVAKDKETTLSTKEAQEKIDYLMRNNVGTIAFTGGEPTIRKDLPEIFSYAKQNGFNIELQTNGVKLADESYLIKLKENGLKNVLIALHSHKEKVSNEITQSKFFLKTVQGIKNTIKHNISISLSHVITSKNYKDLLDYIDFVMNLSKEIHIYFGYVRPNGNALDNNWIVPKLSEVELDIYKALEKCKKNNVSFSVEGIPLCYMQGYEKYCSETQRMQKQAQVYLGSGESKHDDLHEFIHSELKKKGNQCKSCQINQYCAGVWKEYADIYGTDELYPIFHKITM